MFVRESQGIYEFGTKRIEVRVAQNKIMIRVGGGYIGIDEFLDQYTLVELEKQERKDPLKKYSEKLVLRNTIQGKDVPSREFNPAGLPSNKGAPANGNTTAAD